MVSPGAKEGIFLVEENAVSLRTQKEVSVPRDKETVTLMMVVLVVWFVGITTVGITITMLHPMTTVVPLVLLSGVGNQRVFNNYQ